MPAISDQMLATGCAVHTEAVHGERVKVLSGPDKDRTFIAVNELEQDEILTTALGDDPRARRVLRFRLPSVPRLERNDQLQTEDGRVWTAVRRPESQFLTADFELTEAVKGRDD